MHTAAMAIVQKYLEDFTAFSKHEWYNFFEDDHFRQNSYIKWAIKEILQCIDEQKLTPPIVVVENFIHKMDGYSCLNPETSFIFSVAHDIAVCILDELLSMTKTERRI